jgi:hypothetical protein
MNNPPINQEESHTEQQASSPKAENPAVRYYYERKVAGLSFRLMQWHRSYAIEAQSSTSVKWGKVYDLGVHIDLKEARLMYNEYLRNFKDTMLISERGRHIDERKAAHN